MSATEPAGIAPLPPQAALDDVDLLLADYDTGGAPLAHVGAALHEDLEDLPPDAAHRLDRVEAWAQANAVAVAELAQAASGLDRDLATLRGEIASLTEEVARLQNTLGGLGALVGHDRP